MKKICLYFQVHQPYRLSTYRFFDIGAHDNYFDDYANRYIMQQVAEKCYIPANEVLLSLIKKYGAEFKIGFSISGIALEQFEKYAPRVLKSFQKLAETGSVEFLSETWAHSLISLRDSKEFEEQVKMHSKKIRELFGQKPKCFRNTELIYSNDIGDRVLAMGYDTMLTEGAKHILGWKSPNRLYCSASNPKLKLLLKNFRLSDDIAFRFSEKTWNEWPLTADKFISWIELTDQKDEVVNLFMDYETFGEHQWAETGIFGFLKAFPSRAIEKAGMRFMTPSDVSKELQPVSQLNVPYPVSWADEERDITAWLGNELQDEAFNSLCELEGKILRTKDKKLLDNWRYLQTSDHFYYMCTKWFSDGDVHKYFNPYNSPYDAFINYMNVLSDLIIRTDRAMEAKPKRKRKVAGTGK